MSSGEDGELAAYAGRLSHDVKNPLSGIRLALELVREELGDEVDASVLDLLARAERNADRIEQVLDRHAAAARGDSDPG